MTQPHEKTHIQRWEDYLDPHTGVLRNLRGVTDPETWKQEETDLVAIRSVDLPEFGFGHDTVAEELRAIHEHLFQDCYEWAGQYRDVDMMKNHPQIPDSEVAFTPWQNIPDQLDEIQERIDSIEWHDLLLSEKKDALAEIHAKLNYVHPFREGNGRATRSFMEELAGRHDVTITWDGSNDALVFASSASMMHESGLALAPWTALYSEIAEQATWQDETLDGIDALLNMMGPINLDYAAQKGADNSKAPPGPQTSMINHWHSYEF